MSSEVDEILASYRAEVSRLRDENARLERHRAVWQANCEDNATVVDSLRAQLQAVRELVAPNERLAIEVDRLLAAAAPQTDRRPIRARFYPDFEEEPLVMVDVDDDPLTWNGKTQPPHAVLAGVPVDSEEKK